MRENWLIFLITFTGSLHRHAHRAAYLRPCARSDHSLALDRPGALHDFQARHRTSGSPAHRQQDALRLGGRAGHGVSMTASLGQARAPSGSCFSWHFMGLNLRTATAHTKFVNFASNLASLLVFLPTGAMAWGPGIAMGLGQMVGARLGAGMVMKRGPSGSSARSSSSSASR